MTLDLPYGITLGGGDTNIAPYVFDNFPPDASVASSTRWYFLLTHAVTCGLSRNTE